MIKRFVGLFACIAAVPAAATAQRGVEIGPVAGAYVPFGSYEHVAPYWRVGTPDRPGENRAIAVGVEGRAWLNARLGFQLQTVTSSVNHSRVITPAGSIASSTRVTSVTAQAVYSLSPDSSNNHFWVSAGAGAIRHSGSAYVPYDSPTNPTGTLGVGSNFTLSHNLKANVGVSTLMYHWNISDTNGTYQRGFQHDILAHGGVTWDLF